MKWADTAASDRKQNYVTLLVARYESKYRPYIPVYTYSTWVICDMLYLIGLDVYLLWVKSIIADTSLFSKQDSKSGESTELASEKFT
jgi:hypothetical protein